MPLRDITLDDIESLAVGAWVLGTGGGGSPYLGLLNMRALYKEGHRVQLMSSDELADDDWVAAVSNMGAPLVGQERLTDSRTIARAVALMEEHTGHRFRGIMSLEIGGGNSIQPLMAAAHLKRPVIDSDMMGRAYPEAQMTSVAVGDLKPCPLTTVDVRGLESVVEKRADLEMDGAGQPQDLRRVRLDRLDLQGAAHRRRGQEVGHPRHHHQGDRHRPCRARGAAQARGPDRRHPRRSSRARCSTRARWSTSNAAPPKASCAAHPRSTASTNTAARALELNFQNEWIVAWLDGKPIAMSPDLICVLDSVSGEAVGTETIRYGQRVTVIALPPPPVFLSPRRASSHVGPRAFGYDIDFKSVFA